MLRKKERIGNEFNFKEKAIYQAVHHGYANPWDTKGQAYKGAGRMPWH